MVTRTATEAELLSRDAPSTVSLASPRLAYLWRASRLDLYRALREVGAQFAEDLDALFGAARTVQVAGLVLVAAGLFSTVAFIARPLSRRAAQEALLVAELLGQLPPGVDSEGLLAMALGANGGTGRGDGGGGMRVGGGGGGQGSVARSAAGDDAASSAGGR